MRHGLPIWRSRGSNGRARSRGSDRRTNFIARTWTPSHAEGHADVRIAIDSRELAGRPTGVGRYLSELLATWGALPAAASHEFVLCSPVPVDPANYTDLRVSTRVSRGSGTLWEQAVLPRLVKSAGADVLFSPGYTCPLVCRAPIVLAIHDVSFAAHPEWFTWREGLRRRTLTRLGARRARRVITDSDFSKREIAHYLGIGLSRIDVIYLGTSALHQTAGPLARKPLVLFVGSLFNRRHIPELLDGFRRLVSRMPEARLEIVGDNRTIPRIDVEQLIATAGLFERVQWRSYVSDPDLAALYATASAFAFLSDYEGFGLTPLEAMAAGIPIVVLDTPIAREIYGPAAVYLDSAEPDLIASALERVLVRPDERTRLTEAGLQQIERYSWRECAQRTLQVILATP
jgi:glycosyltransferase involved in cell wall biosynthesis